MSRPLRAFLRFARWLVACFVLVAARPAPAMPVLDAVVLVAELGSANDLAARDDAPPADRSTTTEPLDRSGSIAPRRIVDACAPDDVPRVLVGARYLRNCSFLC